jgi:hypothetical protein
MNRHEDVPPPRKREYLREAVRILAARQGAVSPREVFDEMRKTLQMSGIELEPYPTQPGIPRFETITRFTTIRAAKGGVDDQARRALGDYARWQGGT